MTNGADQAPGFGAAASYPDSPNINLTLFALEFERTYGGPTIIDLRKIKMLL